MWKRNVKGSDCVRIPRCKKATVYLVLQSILLLEVIILLSTEYKTKSYQYENSEVIFAQRKKELLDGINTELKNKEVLEDNIKKVAEKNKQLTEQKKQLSDELRNIDEWMCYQSGLYYTSSEMKNWEDSRKDCEGRNTHLMIINNKEELEFFKDDAEVWIGLNYTDAGNTWKWGDGTLVNSGFWAPGEPNRGRGENCAASHSSELYAKPCSSYFKWICERKRS